MEENKVGFFEKNKDVIKKGLIGLGVVLGGIAIYALGANSKKDETLEITDYRSYEDDEVTEDRYSGIVEIKDITEEDRA